MPEEKQPTPEQETTENQQNTEILSLNKKDESDETTKKSFSAYEELVGPGKKFKDQEALAKGKSEADDYIKHLQDEIKGMREDMARLETEQKHKETQQEIENLRKEIQQARSDTSEGETTAPELTEDHLRNIVNDTLEQRETTVRATSNVEQVNSALLAKYGDPAAARTVVAKRADELGMTVEALTAMAAKSPKAVLALLEAEPKQSFTKIGHQSDVNTAKLNQENTADTTPQTEADFEKLRRENPRQYWTPAVQNQLFELMKRQTN